MRLLLFGSPGVGKGTQADLLSKKYNFKKFSMGDLLREEVSLSSSLGDKVKEYMKQGNLVPDDVIFELVENFLIENRNSNILFDGFPRNMNQALSLERSLAQLDMSVDMAIEMYLNEKEIIKRLMNRRQCSHCGRIYNYVTNMSETEGICDSCGHKLIKRVDDEEDVIKKRLEVYEKKTKLLINFYKSLSILRRINAAGSEQEVFKKISETINGYNHKE